MTTGGEVGPRERLARPRGRRRGSPASIRRKASSESPRRRLVAQHAGTRPRPGRPRARARSRGARSGVLARPRRSRTRRPPPRSAATRRGRHVRRERTRLIGVTSTMTHTREKTHAGLDSAAASKSLVAVLKRGTRGRRRRASRRAPSQPLGAPRLGVEPERSRKPPLPPCRDAPAPPADARARGDRAGRAQSCLRCPLRPRGARPAAPRPPPTGDPDRDARPRARDRDARPRTRDRRSRPRPTEPAPTRASPSGCGSAIGFRSGSCLSQPVECPKRPGRRQRAGRPVRLPHSRDGSTLDTASRAHWYVGGYSRAGRGTLPRTCTGKPLSTQCTRTTSVSGWTRSTLVSPPRALIDPWIGAGAGLGDREPRQRIPWRGHATGPELFHLRAGLDFQAGATLIGTRGDVHVRGSSRITPSGCPVDSARLDHRRLLGALRPLTPIRRGPRAWAIRAFRVIEPA